MKIISVAAVTGGGKTTIVNELKKRLSNSQSLHFDDYTFSYRHDTIKPYIDMAFFIDTPLDIALARRILRDMNNADGNEIHYDLEIYLKYARTAFIQMQKDILPSSDHIIDGTMSVEEIVNEIIVQTDYGG